MYGTPYISPNEKFKGFNKEELRSHPVSLDTVQRTIVEKALREVCEYRKWGLYAINVRTNHIHLVAAIGESNPSVALNSFKSYATRKLRENGRWKADHSPWSNKGSKRYLWNERSVEMAVDYVVNGQGGELPKFD